MSKYIINLFSKPCFCLTVFHYGKPKHLYFIRAGIWFSYERSLIVRHICRCGKDSFSRNTEAKNYP